MKNFLMSFVLATFLSCPSSYAEEFPMQGENIRYLKADINEDGVKDEIFIETVALQPSGAVCFITVKEDHADKEDTWFTKNYIEIDYSTDCNLNVLKVGSQLEPYIGIDYGRGMHGRILTLFRYIESSQGVMFLIKAGEFFSDWPMIKVEDIDGDSIKELIEVQRGYENAFTQAEIKIYKHKEGYTNESFCLEEYIEGAQWEPVYTFTTPTMTESFNLYNTNIKEFLEVDQKAGAYEANSFIKNK